MSETEDAPALIEIIDLLTKDGPSVIRSLYLWQQILGPSSDAAARMAGLLGPLVGLPVGADVTPHVVPVPATPTGPVLVAGCMPGGDALFDGFPTDGMRLTGMVEPHGEGRSLRRFQVIGADNAALRRAGGERVMLRYALPPPALVARQLMFAALTRRAPGSAAAPVLRAWIDIEQAGGSVRLTPSESHTGPMAGDETLHMAVYDNHALLARINREIPVTARLLIELTADPIQVDLLGEALVIGG
jgi:hypothetical protein